MARGTKLFIKKPFFASALSSSSFILSPRGVGRGVSFSTKVSQLRMRKLGPFFVAGIGFLVIKKTQRLDNDFFVSAWFVAGIVMYYEY